MDYEVLSIIVDAEKAMQPGAPQLYAEVPNNVAFHWKAGGGDIEKAFREAEVTIKERLVNQRLQPSTIETRGATADYDIGSDSDDLGHFAESACASVFDFGTDRRAREQVARYCDRCGRRFWKQVPVYGPELVVAWLAMSLQTPVRWIEDRRENYIATNHGRDHVDYVELAAKKDGTVLGIRVKTIANMGAWLSTAGPGVPTILFGFDPQRPLQDPKYCG